MKQFGSMMIVGLLLVGIAVADDWPQWNGPNRDNISAEKGLLPSWPDAGPKELWSVTGVGRGYSTVAVARKRVFITGENDGQGYLFCFDAAGKQLWKSAYGPEWTKSYPGARTTPTVDGKNIYLMSGLGVVSCFSGKDGSKIWDVDTAREYKARNISWGLSESLLIDGDNVICTPGGRGAAVVALKKKDGSLVWKCDGIDQKSGYCSPVIIKHGGKRILVTMLAKLIVGLDPKSGKLLWQHPHETAHGVNANTPIYLDGHIFVTSGYGKGCKVIKLNKSGTDVSLVWENNKMDVHHGGTVMRDGVVFGTGNKMGWACLDLKTGDVKWTNKAVGKGSVTYADGMLYSYSENGKVALTKAASDGDGKPVSSFRIKKGGGQHWAHPVVANGVLYIRHGDALMAFNVKGK